MLVTLKGLRPHTFAQVKKCLCSLSSKAEGIRNPEVSVISWRKRSFTSTSVVRPGIKLTVLVAGEEQRLITFDFI